jgi:hypothetical protein
MRRKAPWTWQQDASFWALASIEEQAGLDYELPARV